MRTSKFISTISYNTHDFLTQILNELIDDKRIYFWAFIKHLPEADETKEHKHVLIMPNGRIDTDTIKDKFDEIIIGEEKPRKIMPFRTSKFDDAYMYMIHDKKYLQSKGQKKRFYYDKSDIYTSDKDYLTELVHMIDMSKYVKIDKIAEAVKHGITFGQMVAHGEVPIQQINQYERCYQLIGIYEEIEAKKAYESIEYINGEQIKFKGI